MTIEEFIEDKEIELEHYEKELKKINNNKIINIFETITGYEMFVVSIIPLLKKDIEILKNIKEN